MNAYALIVTGNTRQARFYQQALQSAGFQAEIVTTGRAPRCSWLSAPRT